MESAAGLQSVRVFDDDDLSAHAIQTLHVALHALVRTGHDVPVAAGDRIYFAGRNGTTVVIKFGPKYEVLSINNLDDGIDASPAIVDDQLYIRSHRYLYCIAVD